MYVVGGFDGVNQLRSCERFNPRTGVWEEVGWEATDERRDGAPAQVPSMRSARSGVAAAALDGLLYVVGGWNCGKRLRTGEVINIHLLIVNNHQQCAGVQPSYQPVEPAA